MQMVTYLLIGILIGWGIEWIIDWVFWRRVRESPVYETSFERVAPADVIPDSIVPDDEPSEEITQLRTELEDAQGDQAVLEKRLSECQSNREALDKELDATHAKTDQLQDALNALEATNAQSAQALDKAQAEILQLKAQLAKAQSAGEGDVLQRINGIGPTYAQRLNAAGIRRFAQIAEETVERLREIIGPKSWQTLDIESWIEEAKSLAIEDDLESIDGITPVYKRILNQSRIYTFAQLADLAPAQIEEWIPSEEGVELDLAAWVAQAKALSE